MADRTPHFLSQIEEYLREYIGPGIQHLALATADILTSLEAMQGSSITTLDIQESYYHDLSRRFPEIIDRDQQRIQQHQVLVDGDHAGTLMQIFTENLFGPIFFEFIQSNGCMGFGEANFQTLFESIEPANRKMCRREIIVLPSKTTTS